MAKGLRKFIKQARKVGNKGLKSTSLGLKKASAGAAYLGSEIVDAGEAAGMPEVVKAGELLQEGGKIAGSSSALVEKLRTARSGRDVGEAIAEGQVIADKGRDLVAKVM